MTFIGHTGTSYGSEDVRHSGVYSGYCSYLVCCHIFQNIGRDRNNVSAIGRILYNIYIYIYICTHKIKLMDGKISTIYNVVTWAVPLAVNF